jgi:hypothetical protein
VPIPSGAGFTLTIDGRKDPDQRVLLWVWIFGLAR